MPTEGRNRNGHRTRQLRLRVLAEEHTCRLCGRPIDKTLKNPHPAAPVVDHLTPIARGGSEYDRRNLGLMCRACNRAKSTMTLEEALSSLRGHRPPTIAASPGWGPST